jgi:hypothetical protein
VVEPSAQTNVVGGPVTPTAPRAPLTADELRARGPIGARVAQLRELAVTEPDRAQSEAWEWFKELGADADEQSLDELFTLGDATPMEGPTDGILVAFFVTPVIDSFVMALMGPGRATMPWMGKTFDPETGTGVNRFKDWFPPISRIVFPRYGGQRKQDGESVLFDMDNGIIPDPLDPGHAVWKIEYKDEEKGNPFFVKDVLDCLVEIVPGAHLGRIEHEGRSGFKNLGYFALKPVE